MKAGQRTQANSRQAANGLRTIILAGGKGSRLFPVTGNCPKPLVPLGDTPIIEIIIRRLANFGITNITLALGHSAGLIKAYFHRQKHVSEKVAITCVEEKEPLGTAGALAQVSGLEETFLVMNADLLTNIDFHALIRCHRENGALLTIATTTRRVRVDLGVLEFDSERVINKYFEKPETRYHASMGIYVYQPAVLDYIEPGQFLDFPDLVLRLLAAGERVCAFETDCLWLDIGRPDDYAQAQEMFRDHREEFEFD